MFYLSLATKSVEQTVELSVIWDAWDAYACTNVSKYDMVPGRASVEEVAELRGVVLQDAKFTTDMDIPALVLLSSSELRRVCVTEIFVI